MLSAKTLERVSAAYRKGYYDGHAGRPKTVPETGIEKISDDTIGGRIAPFADVDYENGYKAGANDRKWSDAGFGTSLNAYGRG